MMPTIIEYLLAVTGDKGNLAFPSRWQFIVPRIVPGQRIDWSLSPPLGAYAGIKYAFTNSAEMVPGTLYMEISQAGSKYVMGTVESDWTRDYLGYFVFFTDREPINVQLTNVSVLTQRFVATQWNILIPNEQQFGEVLKHVKAMSSVGTLAEQQKCNDLLEAIKKGVGR